MILSIVIPHYGAPEETQRLVGDLLAQGLAGLEIVVSDDCSPVPFPSTPGCRVLRRETNGGFGSACNSGAAEATGDWLMFLNSDVHLPPDFLHDFLTEAERWPRSWFGPAMHDGTTVQMTTWRWPRLIGYFIEWTEVLARFHGRRWLSRAWGADLSAKESVTTTPTDWMVGACLLMRRADFESVGGFDETFYMNCEEVDLQRRLSEEGLQGRYVPSVSLLHEGGGSSDPLKRLGWVVDARFHYHHKWGGAARLLLLLVSSTLINVTTNLLRRLTGRPHSPWSRFGSQLSVVAHGWRKRAVPKAGHGEDL